MSAQANLDDVVDPMEEIELLDDEEFSIVQGVARQYFGFELPSNKLTMLSRRMKQFARAQGMDTPGQVVRRALVSPTKETLLQLATFITTNHTYFHREPQHFERLVNDVLPAVSRSAGSERDLRIWCAAASTGQEPYELAMCLEDALGENAMRWKKAVLATDISERVLATARKGNYGGEQAAGLPLDRLRNYMTKESDSTFTVIPRIRDLVTFRRLNLLSGSYPFRRPFQVIFCRNVMIYFGATVRMDVLRKLASVTAPGGYLFIGRSESARGMEETLRFIEPGLYRKVGN